jgi:hypothetical protein
VRASSAIGHSFNQKWQAVSIYLEVSYKTTTRNGTVISTGNAEQNIMLFHSREFNPFLPTFLLNNCLENKALSQSKALTCRTLSAVPNLRADIMLRMLIACLAGLTMQPARL